jgi:hypothetical protein
MIGFAGDLLGGVQIDYEFLGIISIMALVGLVIGTTLSKKNGSKLKPAFGWFVGNKFILLQKNCFSNRENQT